MAGSYQGSCLCGAIGYELLSPPKALSHCHCSLCRKGHGAAFASYASVPRSDLRILLGADALTSYASSESVLRQFCSHCGSSLFWSRRQGAFSDWISIAIGTLDTVFTPHKQRHVQVASKAPWFELPDHWAQTE